jgi:hypothetical protein
VTSRSCLVVAGAATAVSLSACGGGARQDAHEPNGKFAVDVPTATFPATQHLAQHSHLVITVHNAGRKVIPDVAVTITDGNLGTSAQAFAENIAMQDVASKSRPVWIVDRGPGPCQRSCVTGGPGGGVTAYSNTWALGPLKSGESKTFDWMVTAVKPGTHVVNYQVAAGLNGKAQAVVNGSGVAPHGSFTVMISGTPQQAYVNDQGQVVTTPAK